MRVEARGVARVVRASGRVDFSTMTDFHETLLAEAKAVGGQGGLVVDLSGLDLITSAGLRVLMQTKKALSEAGAGLVVTGVLGTVADVIRVSRLDTLLTIKPTVDDGVAFLVAGGS